jgi:hypothetical protein
MVSEETIQELRKTAPLYGSMGRALQVATEVLVRQKKPVKISGDSDGAHKPQAYKLLPRTIAMIDRLSVVYGDRGRVLAACVKVLKEDA